jgi:glycosyltransferase involved in cell wall biosynthesis
VRVAIDTSYAARGRTGTAVYVEQLVGALRAHGQVEVVELRQRRRLRPGGAGGRRNPLRSAANLLLDLAWERAGLARASRRAGADVLHHPLPARSPRAGCAQVITVHDLAFEHRPEGFDPSWRMLARRGHRASARAADAIVCPSEATARDAVALLGAPGERIVVAPHGPGQRLPPALEAEDRGPGTHFLYIGSDEPRKDVAALVDAYGRYRDERPRPLELVLAGEAARRAGTPGVRGEPAPDAELLGRLLRESRALVHPSSSEGFGLTLLEAMAAGVPVLAARSPSAEEVCGEAALLVEPGGLAAGLARLEEDTDLTARLAAAGRRRAAEFSWEESARRHEEAYRAALDRYRR